MGGSSSGWAMGLGARCRAHEGIRSAGLLPLSSSRASTQPSY
uniref:Uncharacterized protein n=1 Tax=Arundo donax TaxID=35708 RepID=A0A0A8YYG2_ARUDO